MPKKKPESRISRLQASAAFASIQKQFGSSAITLATEKRVEHVPRLSSRILQLDYALGGGWPIGRINTIYGHKSTGKSTLCTLAAASAQQTCRSCLTPLGPDGKCQCGEFADMSVVYIDVEGTYEGNWGRNLGCDPAKLLISKPDYAEQALDILEALIRSQECDVIILDSIAFLTPAKEIEKSVSEDMVGAQARVSGKAVRKFVAAMNAVGNVSDDCWKPTIFLTNQIRMKVGLLFGNPETQPGGLAWGFAASNEVRVNNGKYEMDKDSGRPLFVDIPFKVDKNKTGVPKMEGQFRMMLSDTETKLKGQIADEHFIITQLERLGILTGSGSSWMIGDDSWRGKKYIEQQLATDPVFSHKIRNMLMTVLLAA